MNYREYLIGFGLNLLAGIIFYYWIPLIENHPFRGMIIGGCLTLSILVTTLIILIYKYNINLQGFTG